MPEDQRPEDQRPEDQRPFAGPDIRPFTGRVTRLTDDRGGGPLIAADMFTPSEIAGLEPDALANINGPSLVRMPDWAAGRRGTFHLYFGHHKGRSIRLAYADDLAGPWRMHPDPVLALADSLFEPVDPPFDPALPQPDWVAGLKGDYLYAHIASPDVHIDADRRRIVMFYHGLLRDGDQQSRVAFSDDGMNFTPHTPLVGPSYLRATWLDGVMYLAMWEGRLARARDWTGPLDLAPHEILPPHLTGGPERQIRHGHILAYEGRLQMTFSRIGDAPEALLHCEIMPADSWTDWRFGPVRELLRPTPGWEGGDLPAQPSEMGTVMDRMNELRDPALFLDHGQVYLAYCGGGESGIGIARVDGL